MSSPRVKQIILVRVDSDQLRWVDIESKWYDVNALAQDRQLAVELVLSSWATETQQALDDETSAYIVELDEGYIIVPKREILRIALVREDTKE